ncbi:uncharacterized protein LOC141710559 isoform X1 [Apium graveolens]|uniref:uncharacterized protein LOC141710559 isoform X1 n=1 Tax=Apium graveolens TaxID=4045 RepID=UPI003D79F43F
MNKMTDLLRAMEPEIHEDYRKINVLAFERETTIALLEEESASARAEKEQAASTIEKLVVELILSNSELVRYKEEVSTLTSELEASKSHNQKLECSLRMLVEAKEGLATQLTETLSALEEVKTIRSSVEKASIQSIEKASESFNAKNSLLSSEVSQAAGDGDSGPVVKIGSYPEIAEFTGKLATLHIKNAKYSGKVFMMEIKENSKLSESVHKVVKEAAFNLNAEVFSIKIGDTYGLFDRFRHPKQIGVMMIRNDRMLRFIHASIVHKERMKPAELVRIINNIAS